MGLGVLLVFPVDLFVEQDNIAQHKQQLYQLLETAESSSLPIIANGGANEEEGNGGNTTFSTIHFVEDTALTTPPPPSEPEEKAGIRDVLNL